MMMVVKEVEVEVDLEVEEKEAGGRRRSARKWSVLSANRPRKLTARKSRREYVDFSFLIYRDLFFYFRLHLCIVVILILC